MPRNTVFSHAARRITLMDYPTCQQFAQHVGSRFTARCDAAPPVSLELFAVTPYPVGADAADTSLRIFSFSIFLRGPFETPLLQGCYDMEHTALGSLLIFIVPIGPDKTGMRYEAVFNQA